jgi:hypothetical protein
MPEPGPLLSARVLNELSNRPWMELRDPVQWGDFEVNWDLQQAGIETEFLAGRLGKSEYERLKSACSREISEFQVYFKVRALPPFLGWARAAHRRLQQAVPARIAESFLVVFDTTAAEDFCRITYFSARRSSFELWRWRCWTPWRGSPYKRTLGLVARIGLPRMRPGASDGRRSPNPGPGRLPRHAAAAARNKHERKRRRGALILKGARRA